MSRAGKILRVDLTERKIEKEPTSSYVKEWFGGDGIGVAIIYNEVPPKTKAYDPDNLLTINMGPLCGTLRGCKAHLAFRSPLLTHNLLHESGLGGQFPSEAKYAGYDNIVVKGKADSQVYLWIDNDKVEIRDAKHLWGLDTYDTQARIKQELNDPDVQVACIGPAGENQIAFALIYHDIKSVAGRCGAGGLMGSKNLKAIAVRGTKGLKVSNPKKFMELWDQYFSDTYPEPVTPKSWTRTSMVDTADVESQLDIFKWGYDSSNLVCPPIRSETSLVEFTRKYFAGNAGCAFCPQQCFVRLSVPGVGAGASICATPGEWQTPFRTQDPDLWWRANLLACRMGLDSLSTSQIISFLMELYDKGIITAADTDGIPMEWGSREAVLAMIEKIGRRQGVGQVLADGVVTAAKRIGRGAERIARHVKGAEYLNYWPWPATALCQVSTLGATGHHGDASGVENAADIVRGLLELHPLTPEMTKEDTAGLIEALRSAKSEFMSGDPEAWKLFEDDGKTIRTTGKASLLVPFEEQIKLADLAGVCDFSDNAGPRSISALRDFWQEMAGFLSADLGVEYTPEVLKELVTRVRLVERGYDYLCGMRREEETMPADFFEPTKTRQWGTRVFMTRDDLEKIKTDYYVLRGCDPETGAPKRLELEKLGLGDLADKLDKLDLQ